MPVRSRIENKKFHLKMENLTKKYNYFPFNKPNSFLLKKN
jgi:hypothetical protein